MSNEDKISFGQGPHWQDIEADEATFDKTVEDSIAHWEQWAGLAARGRPETLVLSLASRLHQQLPEHLAQEPFAKWIGNHLRTSGL